MTNHFYAIWANYLPNSAISNRMLAYLNAWSKMDVDVTVVFTLPDRSFSKVPYSYTNIRFVYLWDKFPIKNRIVHYLLYGLYVSHFRKNLKSGDHIYIYGQANILRLLIKRKDILVYHETTEHPSVISRGIKFHTTTEKDYLNSCRSMNGIFVISTYLKDYLVGNGVDSQKVHIVNMTVDASRFMGIKKQEHVPKYIAYCGKASNNKDGVDQLIKAFAIVNHKYPDILLYIVGQAPDKKDKDNNAQLAEHLGVSDKVVFTGVVPYQEMPQMLINAAILALDRPDNIQAKYGFPTKLGEYLLSGNPVVVTRVGDIPRFIENGVSGMIAEPSNPEDFASKTCWLLENPEEAIAIGERGKKVAMNCFNNEIEAGKIMNAIFK